MDPLTAIAERRILEAIERGEFDMRRRPVNLEVLPEYRDRVEEKLSHG